MHSIKFLKEYYPDSPDAKVSVGDYSYSASGNLMIPPAFDFLKIGKFCSIAAAFEIVGSGHRTDFITTFPFDTIVENSDNINYLKIYKGITIENDVYIGTRCKIHGGVIIRNGAVIAAESVIHPRTEIEPYSVYGGNPAKFVRYRFPIEDREFLLELKWWDFPIEKIKMIIPVLASSNIEKLKTMKRNNLI